MLQITVKSFTDFVQLADSIGGAEDVTIFRGQPVKGNLLPALARGNRSKNIRSHEQEMLEQLNLTAATMMSGVANTPLDILVFAQHFGLRTRLLDWTTNPLIALWFACSDARDGDVYVYAFDATKHIDSNAYRSEPLSFIETRVFQPRFNNPRIIAQQGWLSIHGISPVTLNFHPLEDNEVTRGNLQEFVVPAALRQSILESLDRSGVNASSVFPDFAGLCTYLNWRHRTR